jgi:TRAP-type C4-dicarboxylate transport system permease small subunit
MTALKDKIQYALDESRMLVLGAEILIGFEFAAVFQDQFRELSQRSRALDVIALALMLLTLVLLISPAAYHQIAERGSDTLQLHHFASSAMEAALLPFAIGLGANVYIPADRIGGAVAGAVFGSAMTLASCAFWYGPILLRSKRPAETAAGQGIGQRKQIPAKTPQAPAPDATSLHDRIRQVLTEARVIIPGNQALLGFQFAVILQRGFTDLQPWLKWVHLVSLSLIAWSTVLLLTPAAYHRIVERGEETYRFYRVANAMVLSSLPPLALGVCGDFFVVIFKVSGNAGISLFASLLMLVIFAGLWFGYTWFVRRHPAAPPRLPTPAAQANRSERR